MKATFILYRLCKCVDVRCWSKGCWSIIDDACCLLGVWSEEHAPQLTFDQTFDPALRLFWLLKKQIYTECQSQLIGVTVFRNVLVSVAAQQIYMFSLQALFYKPKPTDAKWGKGDQEEGVDSVAVFLPTGRPCCCINSLVAQQENSTSSRKIATTCIRLHLRPRWALITACFPNTTLFSHMLTPTFQHPV